MLLHPAYRPCLLRLVAAQRLDRPARLVAPQPFDQLFDAVCLHHLCRDHQVVGLQRQIDEIQAEWNQIARSVPAEQLEIFKRVAETYDGQAVVEIEQQEGNKGVYSCGGCFMGITAESVNMLLTKDEIIRCPNCTRILILSDENEN